MEEAPATWIFRFYPYDLDFKQTIVNTLNSKKSEKNTMKMYLLSNSGNSYRTIDQSTKYFQQKLSVLFFDFIKKIQNFPTKCDREKNVQPLQVMSSVCEEQNRNEAAQ